MSAQLELHDVVVRVRGRALLEDVSLRLSPGDFVAVVGPNGAGKTTLMRVALGLIRPASGHARVAGREVTSLSPRERAAHLAWLPQRIGVAEPVTALELVAAARYRFSEPRERSEAAARAALERVAALPFAPRRFTELSGGEQQRVAVAALLAQQAPLLLLDEPANFLDPAQQLDLYALVGTLWRAGLGVLCVTHDVNVLAHVAGADGAGRIRVVGVAQGRVAFEVPYDAPELGERLGELFGVRMRDVVVDGRRVFASAPRANAPVGGTP
ncbi:MAG TPA: ABC transporter ATP-binding protein [Longimicrobium sp.]|nr:ABC transporter ATP-binding protein [Longimicrobium sp.]